MKSIIISLLMFTFLQIVSGQDKIITTRHDTILCQIISISPTEIHYEQKAVNGSVVGMFIPTEQVLEYYRNPQSGKNNTYHQIDRQKQKPENKHYFGFTFAHGIGKYQKSKTWDEDYSGIGIEFSPENSDLVLGINFSTAYISVPFIVKKNIGKYFFLGLGFIAGYEQDEESLCIGALAMAGVEYEFENGFLLSLAPSMRFSGMNLTGNKPGIDLLQHAVVSLGIGYRF